MNDASALVTAVLGAHNRRDNELLASLYDAGATIRMAEGHEPLSVAAWIEIRDGMVESFPDLTFTAGRITASDSVVMFEIQITGTNHGPLHLNDADRRLLRTDALSLPLTGRPMRIDGVVVLEVAAGLITGERHFLNLADTHEQLLLVAPSAPTGRAGLNE